MTNRYQQAESERAAARAARRNRGRDEEQGEGTSAYPGTQTAAEGRVSEASAPVPPATEADKGAAR